MSYPELMGDIALTETELQTRVQDVIEREFPAWKRERALRLGGERLAVLNAFFDGLAVDVDAARVHHKVLRAEAAAAAEQASDPDQSTEEQQP